MNVLPMYNNPANNSVLILPQHQLQGSFIFFPEDNLAKICNAPANGAGVYLVYAMKAGIESLVYIGRSGRLDKN